MKVMLLQLQLIILTNYENFGFFFFFFLHFQKFLVLKVELIMELKLYLTFLF